MVLWVTARAQQRRVRVSVGTYIVFEEYGLGEWFQPSLRDLMSEGRRFPSLKGLGYFRMALRAATGPGFHAHLGFNPILRCTQPGVPPQAITLRAFSPQE